MKKGGRGGGKNQGATGKNERLQNLAPPFPLFSFHFPFPSLFGVQYADGGSQSGVCCVAADLNKLAPFGFQLVVP